MDVSSRETAGRETEIPIRDARAVIGGKESRGLNSTGPARGIAGCETENGAPNPRTGRNWHGQASLLKEEVRRS